MECLRDHALKFFTTRPRYVQEIYQHAWKKLEIRFGRKYLPNVVSCKGCASFQKWFYHSIFGFLASYRVSKYKKPREITDEIIN
jgi:hypothetical protein